MNSSASKYIGLAAVLMLLATTKTKAQNTAGNQLFSAPQIHEIRFTFWQPAYWDSLTNNYTLDKDMRCNMVIDGTPVDTIGIKFKGNSSYKSPGNKKSFKVDLNEFISGQKYDGLKKFNLNNGFKDPTLMREKLMLDFLNETGCAAPRCAYANVYLNNVYWGLYTLVEEIDETFLSQHFSDPYGNLYKGDPKGDLKWYGSIDTAYKSRYELKTNKQTNDWSSLVFFIKTLNQSSASSFYDSMQLILNTDGFIRYWAVTNLFSNLDSYLGSGHNYFIYHNTSANQMHWIAWDVNEAFGNFQMGMNAAQMEMLSMYFIAAPQQNRPLCNRMMHNNQFKQQYIDILCELVRNEFTTDKLNSKIDSLANAIRFAVYADPNKFYPNQQFESNINDSLVIPNNPGAPTLPGLKEFILTKRNSLINQLSLNGCNAANTGTPESPAKTGITYANPVTDELVVQSSFPVLSLEVTDLNGKQLIQSATNRINTRILAAGMYLLKINHTGMYRFIKK